MRFKRGGIRIITAVPFTLLMFSLASGFLTLRLALIYQPSMISEGATYISMWVLLMSVVAFIAGTILALAIVRPVNRMIKRTEEVLSKDEALLPRIEGGTEIESLVYIFGRLISSLADHITSAERSQMELIEVEIRRVEYLVNMGVFSLGLVHEIKNPLGYMRGLVELADKDLSDGDRKKAYMSAVIKGIDRLNSLAEELLTLARIEQMEFEQVKIEEILKEALAISAHNFSRKKIHVHQNYDENSQEVYGSHEKLVQVFSNILINAFEATPEGGTITVSTKSIDSSVLIHIKNTGSYIPPEDREKLFQPFFTKKKDGIGLGLFITKQIISTHSGTIAVESDPQTGTTFSVELKTA